MTPLSERQQLRLLLQTTTPTEVTALETPISPTDYLTWSKSRRRAWDKRYAPSNNYFYHYLHPSFTPRPERWSLVEHRLFLAALKRAPPAGKWGVFSLLLPGRVGSECRRYYHRIGRAGFITLDGKIRNKLFSKARVSDGDTVLRSANSVFLRRSLNKFIPKSLPRVDDTLYKSLLEKNNSDRSGRTNDSGKRKNTPRDMQPVTSGSSNPSYEEERPQYINPVLAQDMLTYIPPKPSEYDGQPSESNHQNPGPSTTAANETKVPCRLRVRDSKQGNNSSRAPKSRVLSNGAQNTVKIVSANVKPTKSTSASSAKGSRPVVKARPKQKESGKSRRLIRSDKKTANGVAKGEKENISPNQLVPPGGTAIQQTPLQRAECGKVTRESKKSGEPNISKEPCVAGRPPNLESKAARDQVTKWKKNYVKPLKPILKSNEYAKIRRENAKTVHFSPTENPAKESPSRKDPFLNDDTTPCKILSKNRSEVIPVVLPQKDAATVESHVFTDKEPSDQHEIDPNLKTVMTDDTSRRTLASENTPLVAAYDSGSSPDITKDQAAAPSSLLATSGVENGTSGHLSGAEGAPVENTSSNVFSQHKPTSPSNDMTLQSSLGYGHVPVETELDINVTSDQECGSMPSARKTTPESFQVFAENSEKHSFEDKPQECVETDHLEQSTSVAESQSTGTDSEFLDMDVEMGAPSTQPGSSEGLEKRGEVGSKLRSSRRVTGLTSGDRISISFLMNSEDTEPQQKKRRLGVDETPGEGTVSLINSDRDVSSATQEEEFEDCHKKEGTVAVRNDEYPKDLSAYQVMQTRVEQTRLMLSIFIDMVDPIGEQLGHKHQRLKLLESFDASLGRLQFTEGYAAKKIPLRIPSLLEAANAVAELDPRYSGKQCTIHVGGLIRYWGAFVDNYIDRLKDMEARQSMEVQSKRIADSVL